MQMLRRVGLRGRQGALLRSLFAVQHDRHGHGVERPTGGIDGAIWAVTTN